ncbi:uncharacterized protein [Gossypium hirsutum]|uniref:Uncharacterized protein isoform X2 n=1 Tax=Gossypium hirsutum TaxID=3635 RepID=A0ABM3AXU7_GOSHI|nr:uncharacterized protein LOC121222600 isoform X2 [Gossypium hirsutum]
MATDGNPADGTPHHSSNYGAEIHPSDSGGSSLTSVQYFAKHDTIKLSSQNFLLWKHQLLLILEGYGLEGFVLGTTIPPSALISDSDGQLVANPTFIVHHKQDKFLASWLLSIVSDDILIHLTKAKTSFDIWATIERRFGAKSNIKLSSMRHALYSIKKASLSVKDYLSKVKTLSDDLTTAGIPVSEQEQISVILAGLPVEFESIRVLATATSLNIDLVTEMLLDCEERQLSQLSDASLQANLVSSKQQSNSETLKPSSDSNRDTNRGQRGPGRGRSRGRARGSGRGWSRSKPQCQLCGKIGHLVQTCYHRFDENFAGSDSSSVMAVNYHQFHGDPTNCCSSQSCCHACPVSSPSSVPDQMWYPDSSATNHITPNVNGLQNASTYTGTNKVSMGNDRNDLTGGPHA